MSSTDGREPYGQPTPDSVENGNSFAPARNRWTFLTNHAHVLIQLHADSELVLREVAAKVGITERAVQRIVHDLEVDGFIERQRVGRRNQYKVLASNTFRHPIEAHCQVTDLLELVNNPSAKAGGAA